MRLRLPECKSCNWTQSNLLPHPINGRRRATERTMLGVPLRDQNRYEEIRRRTKVTDIHTGIFGETQKKDIFVDQFQRSIAVSNGSETGTYVRRAGQGRKRRTSSRDDRFIRLRVRRYPRLTAVQARHELETVRHVIVSERTVRRRFEEAGSFVAAKAPRLEDNALPHTARVTQAYVNDMYITVMESGIPAPANVGELRIAVVEEWRRLSQETIDNIILSMHRQVETLIRTRRGNTRY
ncbi:jg608 [Pararge aegeria aegeria]|uniref:Jg608 protein n=1 Tax=Pararge aegeria aegeria TaxID=348720 RepID=A0A8S4QU35_9NEOP|nr:jg608 [Pararge aegeria aegeria]